MSINKLEVLANQLRIQKGSMVLMTGNITRLIVSFHPSLIEKEINRFIDSIIQRLGEEGTLLFQTFDWDFCKGKPFDRRNNATKTGILGKIALTRSDFIRTRHPIYSFAVTGKYKKILEEIDVKSAFGKGTPFDFLTQKKAKMIVIDMSLQNSFTYVHHVEEVLKVPYRYQKEFVGTYIDLSGENSQKSYYMYVRDLQRGVQTYLEPLEQLFKTEKVMQEYIIDSILVKEIDLYRAFYVIKKDIEENGAKSLHKLEFIDEYR